MIRSLCLQGSGLAKNKEPEKESGRCQRSLCVIVGFAAEPTSRLANYTNLLSSDAKNVLQRDSLTF